VSITNPPDASMFASDPMTGEAAFPVEATADDGMGFGVAVVELLIDGMAVPMGEDFEAPYVWSDGYPTGQYTFQVIATDIAGNTAESNVVHVGVDMEPPGGGDETSGTGDGSGDVDGSSGNVDGSNGESSGVGGTGEDVGGTAGSSADETSSGSSGTGDASGDPSGCGCRGGGAPAPAGLMALMLGLPFVRRRARAR
jgi:MYXO-CTERM domain-containing protein